VSWQAARDALDIDMNPTCKLVYIALALRAGDDGRAWPSLATTATDTGLDESTVRRALHRLKKAGHIALVHRPGRSSLVSVTPGRTPGVPRDLCAPTPGVLPGVPRDLCAPTPGSKYKKRGISAPQKSKEEKKEVSAAVSSARRTDADNESTAAVAACGLCDEFGWLWVGDVIGARCGHDRSASTADLTAPAVDVGGARAAARAHLNGGQ
jgi:hypothetical protein